MQGKGRGAKLYSGHNYLPRFLYLFITFISKMWPGSAAPAFLHFDSAWRNECHFCKRGPWAWSRTQQRAHLFPPWWSAGLFDQWFPAWAQMCLSTRLWLQTREADSSACSRQWHAWPTHPLESAMPSLASYGHSGPKEDNMNKQTQRARLLTWPGLSKPTPLGSFLLEMEDSENKEVS